ncbi:MAG: hypothetical protein ACLGIM_14045 [Alphaproteobacteria bacterium]
MKGVAPVMRDYVASALAPIIAENKALKEQVETIRANVPERGPPGEIGPEGKAGADGRDGNAPDPEEVAAMVREEVAKAVAALPPPDRGEKGEQGLQGERGFDGADGKDADPSAIAAVVDKAVAKAVSDLPKPERGERGEVGEKGEQGEAGKDGAGIADLVIDRDGNLIASFTDGRLKALGQIIGKDGRDGIDGKDGIPFGVDDLNMSLMEDGRTIRLAFAKGETEYAFQIGVPTMIYRGVYREGSAYEQGDTVTWGGSLWHADKATTGKPDGGDWTLAAKRGRDGRDKL